MTDVTISSGPIPELERSVPALAVRRDLAHVLLVADDEQPEQLLADVLDERTAEVWLRAPARASLRLLAPGSAARAQRGSARGSAASSTASRTRAEVADRCGVTRPIVFAHHGALSVVTISSAGSSSTTREWRVRKDHRCAQRDVGQPRLAPSGRRPRPALLASRLGLVRQRSSRGGRASRTPRSCRRTRYWPSQSRTVSARTPPGPTSRPSRRPPSRIGRRGATTSV